MKASIKKRQSFQPIDLTITINTIDELKELYHRFNVSWEDIVQMYLKEDLPDVDIPNSFDKDPDVFMKISYLLEEQMKQTS